MTDNETQISVRGKQARVPRVAIEGRDIIIEGKWIRCASVRDEYYFEGEPVPNPMHFVSELQKRKVRADLFTFSQRISKVEPMHSYPVHLDNVASLPITNYARWWDSLSQETRRNVRLSSKRGVECRVVPFSDELVQGITEIYNETPVRQGRRFWHYGKDFETVKRDNSSYVERSRFIAAYRGAELIGFIKMVYVDEWSGIMQILAKSSCQQLRPTNALIAKAVETCAAEGRSHLLYCKYTYHKGYDDPLREFKRRNGFQEVFIPRYFIPMTWKGRLFVFLQLHRGLSDLLPSWIVNLMLRARKQLNESRAPRRKSEAAEPASPPERAAESSAGTAKRTSSFAGVAQR